ncbi:transcriptional regulator [Atlantibacter subterranea]|uniref:Transcriptional regulator n=1 Tax=Atlantibacter subterraneus TaxID=255519 RepID=A0A3R9G3Y5_9ENTR|nr:transcriptional regulator [Atlantibacter subterranea]RSE04832.1 transcriptional regulator [Atlantibacter subterranea]RSE22008.1 transcriptional regulator [Atlantibacter subterranea]
MLILNKKAPFGVLFCALLQTFTAPGIASSR